MSVNVDTQHRPEGLDKSTLEVLREASSRHQNEYGLRYTSVLPGASIVPSNALQDSLLETHSIDRGMN